MKRKVSLVLFAGVLFFCACDKQKENRLTGIWISDGVQMDFVLSDKPLSTDDYPFKTEGGKKLVLNADGTGYYEPHYGENASECTWYVSEKNEALVLKGPSATGTGNEPFHYKVFKILKVTGKKFYLREATEIPTNGFYLYYTYTKQ